MNQPFKLVLPLRKHKHLWKRFRKDFAQAGERHSPGIGSDKLYSVFLWRVRKYALGKRLPKGYVPGIKYFLMDAKECKILGVVDIRYQLNENLLYRGGHIGYSIAPGERRKGYATEQLRMALEICRDMGIEHVLITCDSDNIGSAKAIERNGGVMEDERLDGEGAKFRRYWIDL